MMSNKFFNMILTSILLLSVASCLIAKDIDGDTVLAEYDGGKVTKADIDAKLEKVPPMYQARYKTLDGQQSLVDIIIRENIFMLEALSLGLDKDPEITSRLEMQAKPLVLRTYKKDHFSNKIEFTEAEMKEFYNENKKIFTQKKRSDIKYIKVENDSIAKLAEEAFNNGTDFIDVMNQYSTCKYAKERGGYIKGLLHNGYITGVGRDEELDKLIQEAKIGELNGPIKTDKGIHFFILENKVPELLKPYEEVKSHIQTRMRPIKDKQIYDDLITSLNDKYDFKIDNEVINSVNFNEKDYFINNGDKILTSSSNENLVFTINDVYHLFLRIPPQEKAEITTPRAQQAWIKRALDDQLYTQDAIDNNYKQRIEETDDYQQILKSLILRKTYTELIINKIEITEEDLNNNYNENIDKYTKKESRKVQLFKSATMKNAKKAKKSFLKADKKSKPEIRDEAIAKYCLEIDNEGIIEKVYKDKDIIPGFGKDENLKSAIWQTLPDNYSEIIETADGEFVFAYIIEETPAEITPLDNVKQKIEKFLRGSKSKEKFEEVAAELDSKYNLVKHYERLQLLLSADELFDLAEKSAKNGKYSDAVMYYDQIIKSYKNNNDDYKALFMKGFLYSEEMKENDKALETFKTLIKDYPAGDLHDSAQYMIDTLSGNAEPVFLD